MILELTLVIFNWLIGVSSRSTDERNRYMGDKYDGYASA